MTSRIEAIKAALLALEEDKALTPDENDKLVVCLMERVARGYGGIHQLLEALAAFSRDMATQEREVRQDEAKAKRWDRLAAGFKRLTGPAVGLLEIL
jgi:hypothetical protein